MGGKCIPFWAYLPICMSMQFFLQFDSSMICFCSTQAQLALYKSWKEVLDCRKWNCSSVPVITLFVPTSTGMILGLPWLRAMCIAIKLLGPLVIQISQVFQISRSPRCHPGPDIPELLKISLEWWRSDWVWQELCQRLRASQRWGLRLQATAHFRAASHRTKGSHSIFC